MTVKKTEKSIIVDDGTFYIQLDESYEHRNAPGFLLKRCNRSITTPSGFQVLGEFAFENDIWFVDLHAVSDSEDDAEGKHIGKFDGRLDAIHALWKARI
jgi:hypothetical protein